mmetsp:Transcript_24385/g.38269  ORF Transcript_24385/g.38269 Transcript_24385/m.38269 type:complete len:969 (+) Transcript_24385:327-3233(+)
MMGGSCSTQRRHHHHDDGRQTSTSGVRREAHDGCTSSILRRGRFRSSRLVTRFCGGSQDGSSDDEGTHSMKRSARHSVDAEIPDQLITHFYPVDDNYDPHPTDPTLRCPKSLTDLCVQSICRSLPNLEGELPPGLPQDIVDRIVQSLTSHSALNSTTLRALSKCELGTLNLHRARGVSDEWMTCISSFSSRSGSTSFPGSNLSTGRQAQAPVPSSPPLRVVSSFAQNNAGSRTSPMMMDLGEYDDYFDSAMNNQSPLLPSPGINELHEDDNANEMEDCCVGSFGSRSTSSFVSAKEEMNPLPSSTPLLPSVLPPPEFYSMNPTPTPTSSLWLHQSRNSSLNDPSNVLGPVPLLPLSSSQSSPSNEDVGAERNSLSGRDEMNCEEACLHPTQPTNSATSTITLLDLRGSQRLSDRGLLQLSHTPLYSLEVARLDNCHGISGRGLLAFSRSYKMHTLSLSNCRRLTDEAVVNISHLGGSLMTLNLGGSRCLTDRSLEAMSGLLELRQLDLSQCDLITNEGLTNLANLDQIEELSLGWCRLISDDGLEILSGHGNRTQTLRVLHLARCPITDDGLVHLSKLKKLQELDLNGCSKLSSQALSIALGKLVCLFSLDVSYCPGILRSPWQGNINALKSLELNYSAVRDSHLSRLKHLPMLEELNLDSCLIGDWGVAHLADNNVVPNLTSLDLADTDISDFAMQKIAQFEHLKNLSLFYCNISNAGLRHLSSMKKLEVLNLDSREIGDDGLRYLRHLPLKALDLFSGRVTDLGCAYLSKIKTLTSLELCGGGVGDLGCAHLATIYNLTSLNLSQNERITNRGAASLATLSNLKALNLSNTHVNSDALKFFSGLSQLQSLALYGCKDVEDNTKLDTLQSELPLLRCVRLNNVYNEDGVIDHGSESEEDEEGDLGNDAGGDNFELDDESSQRRGLLEHDHFYHQLESEGDSVGSEEGMSIFEDAQNEEIEIESVSTE